MHKEEIENKLNIEAYEILRNIDSNLFKYAQKVITVKYILIYYFFECHEKNFSFQEKITFKNWHTLYDQKMLLSTKDFRKFTYSFLINIKYYKSILLPRLKNNLCFSEDDIITMRNNNLETLEEQLKFMEIIGFNEESNLIPHIHCCLVMMHKPLDV